jgi:hypothetical protein
MIVGSLRGMLVEALQTEPRDGKEAGGEQQAGSQNGALLKIPQRMHAALAALLEAHLYARDADHDTWDFAIDFRSLRRLGVTSWDCRWLVAKGLARHGIEQTLPGEPSRSFRQGAVLVFARRTCLVLTEAGVEYARNLGCLPLAPNAGLPLVAASGEIGLKASLLEQSISHTSISSATAAASVSSAAISTLAMSPTWDRDRQQLRVGKLIVKEFKVPASNQEAILAAFQEENWPPRIDDPLSPVPDQDPKRRLHDTINSLNRNQKQSLIRFLGDGSGQGVRWEFNRTAKNGH